MHLSNGTLLRGGTYKIVRYISSGGFGCTYEAEHILLDKRVAIKEFFVKDFCNRDEATKHVTIGTDSKRPLAAKLKQKFVDEARAVSKLHHQNIVSVTDVFEENGTAYFVMDYIDGRSLSDVVNGNGPLSEADALNYIRQVADALAYVHGNNRLHLDIKPGNIMVDGSGHAVLIDFGASKQYDECDGENTSTLIGKTPGYAPPEQMLSSIIHFLPAADIYALGATLYKLLSGVTPIEANLRSSGEELLPLPSSVSPTTCTAIDKAMQLNKAKRPQSVEEFLQLLDGGGDGKERVHRCDVKDREDTEFFGYLNLSCYPSGSTVKVDGVDIGVTPIRNHALLYGTHMVDVSSPGYKTLHRTITIGSSPVQISDDLKESNVKKLLFGVLGGIVSILLVVLLWPGGGSDDNDVVTPVKPTHQLVIPSDREDVPESSTSQVVVEQKTKLYVESNPSGATVYVDGKSIGKTPIDGKEYPAKGTHKIELRKDGYITYSKSFTFGSSPVVINRTLERKVVEPQVTSAPVSSSNSSSESINGLSVRWGSGVTSSQKDVLRGLIRNMVSVEGGTFMMGANSGDSEALDDEKPRHSVTLSGYRIGKYEVMQKEWVAVMGSNPSSFKGDNLPVEMVSWNDCQAFIQKLNGLTGLSFRLPTEAEWEYAARGGNRSIGYKYSGGDNIGSVAWYTGNSGNTTHPVGRKQGNELGLYDMTGNVWEWCSDWYGSSYYSSSPSTNPHGPSSGSNRVFRGGSWDRIAGRCRVSNRGNCTPSHANCYLGLRLAL